MGRLWGKDLLRRLLSPTFWGCPNHESPGRRRPKPQQANEVSVNSKGNWKPGDGIDICLTQRKNPKRGDPRRGCWRKSESLPDTRDSRQGERLDQLERLGRHRLQTSRSETRKNWDYTTKSKELKTVPTKTSGTENPLNNVPLLTFLQTTENPNEGLPTIDTTTCRL